jgi:hypothetical protein
MHGGVGGGSCTVVLASTRAAVHTWPLQIGCKSKCALAVAWTGTVCCVEVRLAAQPEAFAYSHLQLRAMIMTRRSLIYANLDLTEAETRATTHDQDHVHEPRRHIRQAYVTVQLTAVHI